MKKTNEDRLLSLIQNQPDWQVFHLLVSDSVDLPMQPVDVVVCRWLVSRAPDAYQYLLGAVKMLKPGALLVLEDRLMPDDERAAQYINAFERLRDVQYEGAFAEYEWRGLLLDVGLRIEQVETGCDLAVKVLDEAQPADVKEKLQIMLVQAPHAVTEYLHPRYAYTPDAQIDEHYILMVGNKPI